MIVRPDRRLLLPALAAAHGMVLLLIAQSGSFAAAVSPPGAITVASIAAPQSTPVAMLEPKLLPVTAAIEPPLFETSAEDTVHPVEVAASASGGGCNLDVLIQTSIGDSASVRAALAQMPREARSVANAQMLWDGHWADAAQLGGPETLAPLRALVAATVRAAPPECRDAPVTGPRLLFVSETSGTRILGFGSGIWAWSQLLSG